MESDTKNEILLLIDQAGGYYAIPAGDLAAYKVTGEGRDELEQVLGAEVQGYHWKQNFVLANPMVDPPSIFGGSTKEQAIGDPTIDTAAFVQMGRLAGTLMTFVGTMLRFGSAVSVTDILKRVE